MQYEDLKKIIDAGPDTVAFFESEEERDSITNTICAFSNSGGGYLVFGMHLGPAVKGQSVLQYPGIWEDTETIVSIEECGKRLIPGVPVDVSRIKHDGKTFLVATVPDTEGKVREAPDGKVWNRVNGQNLVTAPVIDSSEIAHSESIFSELDQVLAAGESDTVEFLKTPVAEQVINTVSAFANTSGGKIYIGIDESVLQNQTTEDGRRRSLVGISKKEAEELLIGVAVELYPSPDIQNHAYPLTISGKSGPALIVVHVSPRKGEPVVFRDSGVGFVREGEKNVPAIQVDPSGIPGFDRKDTAEQSSAAAGPNARSKVFGGRLGIVREASLEEECLSASQYAGVLTGFFADTDEDVSLGLFGHWGRGKTYLINKVANRLRDESDYEIATFSAWKYRTTPELWVHLYETIADAARKSDSFMWLFVPVRVALAKHGVWTFILAFFGFGILLLTASDKIQLLALAVQFLGLGGAAYLAIVAIRSTSFGAPIRQKLSIVSHRPSLGLQAAIGDDLRALLIGWMPKSRWVPEGLCTQTRWWKKIWNCLYWPGILAYVAVVVLVLWNLKAASGKHTFHLPILGEITIEVPTTLPPIIQYLWFIAAFVVPLLSFFLRQGPKRLLLVVDDLDRCEPGTMLEIIESVTLLLDDDQIKQRMQVAMLVEEDALETSLIQKYEHLWSSVDEADRSRKQRQIVTENKEKIFLSHLRLPLTSEAELRKLFRRYMAHESDEFSPVEQRELNNSVVAVTPDPILDPISGVDFTANRPTTPTLSEIRNEFRLGKDEQAAIWASVASLTNGSDPHGHRWGPRAVRCFLHKYRLARVLIKEVGGLPINPELIVKQLLNEDREERVFPEQDVAYFCSQVS